MDCCNRIGVAVRLTDIQKITSVNEFAGIPVALPQSRDDGDAERC